MSIYIGAVKRPRGPNAQCRVDRGFAGFPLSLASPESVRNNMRDARVPAAARALPRARLPFVHSPTSASTPVARRPAAGRRRRRSERARDPMLRLPFLVRRCLSLARCLAYVRARSRLRFPQLPFFSPSPFRRRISIACVRPRERSEIHQSVRDAAQTTPEKGSGRFRKRFTFVQNVPANRSLGKAVESFRETKLFALRFDVVLVAARLSVL